MAVVIKKCPKCGHVRQPEERGTPDCCPACGLYFEKWANRNVSATASSTTETAEIAQIVILPRWRIALHERLTNLPGRGEPVQFYLRLCMLVLFAVWGFRLAQLNFRYGEMGASFMHNILLPIHEAGHVLFIPFGQFMTILGGSLFQLLLPLIVAGTVLWQNRDPFGAALGVWWCGVSLLDLAPYIYDAKQPQLIMLGGHTGEDGPHDWIYLLGVFHRIEQSQTWGAVAHKLGVMVMLAGLAAAAFVMWRMWRLRKDGRR